MAMNIQNKKQATPNTEMKIENKLSDDELIKQIEFFGFIPEQFIDELYTNILNEIDKQILKLSSHNANLIYPELVNEFNKNYRIFKCYCLNYVFLIKNVSSVMLNSGDGLFPKNLNIKRFREIIETYKTERVLNIKNQLELKRLQLMNDELENILKYKNQVKKVLEKSKKFEELKPELEKFNKTVTENYNIIIPGNIHFQEKAAASFLIEKENIIKLSHLEEFLSKNKATISGIEKHFITKAETNEMELSIKE